ncbi:MAG: hypothetical protein C4291_03875 [Candidatus Dadabacteria bacterium]
MEDKPRGRKRPTLALILSAIFPGFGQIYNNQIPKGIILISLNMVINLLLVKPIEKLTASGGSIPDNPTLLILAAYMIVELVLWVYAMIDAKRTAEKINKSEVT